MSRGDEGMKKLKIQGLRKAGIRSSGLSDGETTAPWKLSMFILYKEDGVVAYR